MSLGDKPISLQSKSPSSNNGLPAFCGLVKRLFKSVKTCCLWASVKFTVYPCSSLGLNITAPEGLAPLFKRLMLCLLAKLC